MFLLLLIPFSFAENYRFDLDSLFIEHPAFRVTNCSLHVNYLDCNFHQKK